jgi:hypothetical protein
LANLKSGGRVQPLVASHPGLDVKLVTTSNAICFDPSSIICSVKREETDHDDII